MLKWFKKNKPEEISEEAAEAIGDTTEEEASAEISGHASAPQTAVEVSPDAPPEAEIEPEDSSPAAAPGFFGRLTKGLSKSQQAISGQLRSAVGLKKKVDEELIEDVEDILLQADVGISSTEKISERLRKLGRKHEAYDPEAIADLVKESIAEILNDSNRTMELQDAPPTIVLVVGVNGVGKTTTIGKIALEFSNAGKKVMLVAGDTFRAAAVEQLAVWAERSGAGLVTPQKDGADPASVCYEALSEAKEALPDVVLIDTAGRLHTKKYLMEELSRVIRVIKKIYPEAPHETILVLDATTGQNALQQVHTFREVTDVTGLVMTKLDGTAKGGILIAIKDAHPDLPVFKIGIGEAPEDLRDFHAKEFAEALFAQKD